MSVSKNSHAELVEQLVDNIYAQFKNPDGKLAGYGAAINNLMQLPEEQAKKQIRDYAKQLGPNSCTALLEGKEEARIDLAFDIGRAMHMCKTEGKYDHQKGLNNFASLNLSKHNNADTYLTERKESAIAVSTTDTLKTFKKELHPQLNVGMVATSISTTILETNRFQKEDIDRVGAVAAGMIAALSQTGQFKECLKKGSLPGTLLTDAVQTAKRLVEAKPDYFRESPNVLFHKGQELIKKLDGSIECKDELKAESTNLQERAEVALATVTSPIKPPMKRSFSDKENEGALQKMQRRLSDGLDALKNGSKSAEELSKAQKTPTKDRSLSDRSQ